MSRRLVLRGDSAARLVFDSRVTASAAVAARNLRREVFIVGAVRRLSQTRADVDNKKRWNNVPAALARSRRMTTHSQNDLQKWFT